MQQRTLGEIADVISGPPGYQVTSQERQPSALPVIHPGSISSFHRVIHSQVRYLPANMVQSMSRFRVQEGDVVVVRQGALGRIAYIQPQEDGWIFSPACSRIRVNANTVIPEFLAWYLSSTVTVRRLQKEALPGTVSTIQSESIRSMVISIPSIADQEQFIAMSRDITALRESHEALSRKWQQVHEATFQSLFDAEEQL